MGLPCSRVITFARCSLRSCISRAASRKISARYWAVVAAHSSWTAAAASMAICVSPRPASGRVASVSPLAGFVTSNVLPEAAESHHSPPTKRFSIMLVSITFPPVSGSLRGPAHPAIPGRHGLPRGPGRQQAHYDEHYQADEESDVDRTVGEQTLPGQQHQDRQAACEHGGEGTGARGLPPEQSPDNGYEDGAYQQVVGDREGPDHIAHKYGDNEHHHADY